MAVFKSLTFDGINSLNYGIYITGEAVYNAPERAVEMVTIPGRNGALAIDQGYFENIEVSYPCGCFADTQAEFASKVSAFRNAIASRYSYKRLTDEYNADEYRLGLYKSGLEVDAVRYSTAGQFTITFDCKPQRFLLDGDAELSPTDYSDVHTVSGDIVQIDNDGSLGVKSVLTTIEPIQSGSGTPSPDNVRPISGHTERVTYVDPKYGGTIDWNQLLPNGARSNTASGISYTRAESAPYILNGTASSNAVFKLNTSTLTAVAGHKYLLAGGKNSNVCTQLTTVSVWGGTNPQDAGTGEIATAVNSGTFDFVLIVKAGTSVTNEAVNPQFFDLTQIFGEGNEPTTAEEFKALFPKDYYPYNAGEKTCVSAVNGDEYHQYTTNLGRTVYGGTLDVVSGVLTVTDANIASYNGETLPSTWISDRDVYSSGTTPTTGAQVVYKLSSPQTYQLTPQEVELLLGQNNLWTDCGETSVEYGIPPYYNPTEFDAKPLIKVTGRGTLGIGEYILTITGTVTQTLYIDCETMEIYTLEGTVPTGASSLVSINKTDFPVLKPGHNGVSVGTGLSALKITPRWWRV